MLQHVGHDDHPDSLNFCTHVHRQKAKPQVSCKGFASHAMGRVATTIYSVAQTILCCVLIESFLRPPGITTKDVLRPRAIFAESLSGKEFGVSSKSGKSSG